MQELGELNYFPGINIDCKNDKIYLSQRLYLENVFARFRMKNCNSSRLRIGSIEKLTTNIDEDIIVKKVKYRQVIGCLMYAAYITRVDCFRVNFLSRFQSNATQNE